MGLEHKVVQKLKEDFKQEYASKEPYNNYINGIGITILRVQKETVRKQFKLKKGETLDDLCLSVYLKEELPKDLDLPSEYKGVRVFYTKMGPITARPAYPDKGE